MVQASPDTTCVSCVHAGPAEHGVCVLQGSSSPAPMGHCAPRSARIQRGACFVAMLRCCHAVRAVWLTFISECNGLPPRVVCTALQLPWRDDCQQASSDRCPCAHPLHMSAGPHQGLALDGH